MILFFWGPLLLSVPFENAFNLSGSKVAEVIIVDHHNRCKETSSKASNRFKGIKHIFGRFIRFNAQSLCYRVNDIRTASDVTSCAAAAAYGMAAVRFQIELLIECRNTVDLTNFTRGFCISI